jgi:ATP-dependent Clp protease ATP-binding subunit ClpA
MIETGLQQEINHIMSQARNNRLEFVTVEHLLIALLNMDEVVSFLRHKQHMPSLRFYQKIVAILE